jgi:hypothetical protein
MLKILKKTPAKLLVFFILFTNLYIQSPITKTEVKAEACAWNSNVLDAKCKCQRNQCRLSKTGATPQLNESGANNNKNTSLFSSGEYDCFDAGTVLGEDKTFDIQNKYKAIYALNPTKPSDLLYDRENPKCPDTLVYDDVERSPEARAQLNQYTLLYIPTEKLKDETKAPCYLFSPSDKSNEDGVPYLNPDDVLKSRFGFIIDEESRVYCGKTKFMVGVLFFRNATGVSCRYRARFDPAADGPDYDNTTSRNKFSFVKNCTVDGSTCEDSTVDSNYTPAPKPTSANKAFYEKFYVDEFNRLPNNQSIPIGAICKVTAGATANEGYSYWYYPEYFKLVGGSAENTCSPILVKRDLFGKEVSGTPTFFGCLPNSTNGATAFFVRLATGMAGFITLLVAIINLLKIIGSSNNPDAIAEARKKMTGAVMTFIFLLASITILSILGLKVLDIGGIGGGIFRLFTGG